MSKELARDLIAAGVHFGHGVSRWNPKMEPYIFGKRSKIHIINVRETLRGLLVAKKLLQEVVSEGRDVVFVGTKRQAQEGVRKAAERCGMHYVSERWLGGMLTNFRTIRSRLQRLEELEAMANSGEMEAESKKQASRWRREMRKIDTNLGGVRKMNRLPGVVVVVDARREYIALREANKLGVATVAILDTDSDPDTCDVAIPANDDSLKAIEILLNELADAVAVGKTMVKPSEMTPTGPGPGAGRVRSRRRALASAAEEESAGGETQEGGEEPQGEQKPAAEDSAETSEAAQVGHGDAEESMAAKQAASPSPAEGE